MVAELFEEVLGRAAALPADASAERIDRAVHEVVRLMREHLEMDVAFVSHLHGGRRYFVTVDTRAGAEVIAAGDSAPAEESFCQRVIDGRLPQSIQDVRLLPGAAELPATPFGIGSHLSTPVVLGDGSIYGTMCCFTFAAARPLVERDLKRLRMAADLTARLIDQRHRD
ncbi:MAG: diguanylate cyclase [Variovorax paradoxus]|uniref:Diguanylate cyclase n=1 Tax=Variovorax paradoxus TaxID=34073 RepID=A0A2W5QGB6_VARPD|nr:MAG: diguanylate cyclase [Variovorax paradoxus]